ncbi:MAG: hypothetical protein Q9225_001894 [Loekoesia sp. 1 TL-2023]
MEDDALRRLAPSLRTYEGCTIIDVNPGIGLWSSKLHDIVRPKKHFLAEPPSSPFLPHLEPLANQQNSRYHLLDWQDEDVWEPGRYVAEGLLPAFDTSKAREPEQPILILANTAIPTPRSTERVRAKSYMKFLDWGNDVMLGSGFHAGGGPIRMLMWCPEKEVTPALPRTIRSRSKLSLFLEMTSHVEAIVSADVGTQKIRDRGVELMSGQQVARRMQSSGITIPDGRHTDLYEQVQEELVLSAATEKGSRAPNTEVRIRGWHRELQNLQQRFEAGEFLKAEGMSPGEAIKKRPKGTKLTPEYARLVDLERELKHIQKRTKVIDELLQEQAEIDALDLRAYDSNLEASQQAAAQTELQERKKKLQERVESTPGQHIREEFQYFKHERKAYSQNPPLLIWDRRTAEPLKSYDEEFYPEKGLCLLDIKPKQPLQYRMTAAQGTIFSLLMTALYRCPAHNLSVLDQIAPGAFEALTPKIPALTDPSRGGERDLRDLPIDRLTPEMAYGLTVAWQDWPFKPDLADLLLKGPLSDTPRR